jgi:G2/mitotic-specific cyclin 1/2
VKTNASTAATTATTNAVGGQTRATAATAASRAKIGGNGEVKVDLPAGKRKREALGEVTGLVTNNNKAKSTTGVKGKDKETIRKERVDGAVKSKMIATRQPLRTIASARQTSKPVVAIDRDVGVKEEAAATQSHDENAMIIDPPVQVPVLKRLVPRRSVIAGEYTATTSRQSDTHRRAFRSVAIVPQKDEDAEADRAFKKRRTSSEAPSEKVDSEVLLEERLNAESEARFAAEQACAAEPEADPEGSQWDDLDSDDIDDPLMVSEYVVDIFKYLKQVEVSFPHFLLGFH